MQPQVPQSFPSRKRKQLRSSAPQHRATSRAKRSPSLVGHRRTPTISVLRTTLQGKHPGGHPSQGKTFSSHRQSASATIVPPTLKLWTLRRKRRGIILAAAAKFLCHEQEVFPAHVRPQIFPTLQSYRLAQRPSQLGVEARHVRWQVHWRGQARDILFGGLYFFVEGAKGRWLIAQRELLFPFTQEEEFSLSPGGRAQARRFLDEAKIFGCGHQPPMRVSQLTPCDDGVMAAHDPLKLRDMGKYQDPDTRKLLWCTQDERVCFWEDDCWPWRHNEATQQWYNKATQQWFRELQVPIVATATQTSVSNRRWL